MKTLSIHFNPDDLNDSRSLIEIIVARFGGSIRILPEYYGDLYRVHDWVYILGESKVRDRREPWHDLRRYLIEQRIVYPVDFKTIDEKDAKLGGTHRTDYCDEKMIYFITQYMTPTNRVKSVRKYLADAGVMIDAIRRNPELGYEAMREAYRMKGKDEAWIDTRIKGITYRHRFTDVISKTVSEKDKHKYARLTTSLCVGLWRRDPTTLAEQMQLPDGANLRDHQPRLALLLEQVAEEVSAFELGKELGGISVDLGKAIVLQAANEVGEFADKLSEKMGKDIPTDKPLEPGYELPQIGEKMNIGEDKLTPRLKTPRFKPYSK